MMLLLPVPLCCITACLHAAYVNVVMLSFAKPDCTYAKGSLSFAGTGLEFTAAGSTVKAAIAKLKATNANTRVLLAVGGGAYKNWQAMNGRCLKDIVDDFVLDGENTTLAAGVITTA
jgi:chitinase